MLFGRFYNRERYIESLNELRQTHRNTGITCYSSITEWHSVHAANGKTKVFDLDTDKLKGCNLSSGSLSASKKEDRNFLQKFQDLHDFIHQLRYKSYLFPK